MSNPVTIRRAGPKDAAAVSDLIVRVLHISSMADYGPENIARVAGHFNPDMVAEAAGRNHMLMAEQGGRVVGTASLGGTALDPGTQALRTFFVDPDVQGKGIGSILLTTLEAEARRIGLADLHVRSSVGAEPFYAARGFAVVAHHIDGDERTIQMAKPLA